MQRLMGMMLLLAGASTFAMGAFTVPEIGAGSAGSAFALLSGTLLIIRGRRRK
jgi:hypothetical protein